MAVLFDSDVAIHLRDGDMSIATLAAKVDEQINLSLVTVVELQAGLVSRPALQARRLAGYERLLARYPVIGLDQAVVDAYGRILAHSGFSRTRVFDRLIAATAIVHDLTLVTINGTNFRDIPGLKLEVWPSPPQ